MAIPDHDGNTHIDRGTDANLSTIGFIAVVFIIGLLLLFMVIPRTDTPTSATSNQTKAPVTTTTPSTPTAPK